MALGKHQRTELRRFRKERSDSLLKNLKEEYSVSQPYNGNMKLGTLLERENVDSLSQLLKKLKKNKYFI